MKVLIGDSAGNGNSSVGAGDIGFVKSVSGQTTGAGNFRADIAINGTINASDVGLVKSKSGNHCRKEAIESRKAELPPSI